MSKDSLIFKLIVQNCEASKELLKYLDKNITEVNRLGVVINIKKINKEDADKELVETFRKKGITRLPALVAPDGKPFIGLKRAIDLFEQNLNKNNTRQSDYGGPASNSEFGSNPDLTSFYMKELYNGVDQDGYMIPRNDPDEGEDNGSGLERRMAEYRRIEPSHRRQETTRRRERPEPTRGRGREEEYDEPEDNIEDDEPVRGGGGGGGRNDRNGRDNARIPYMAPTEDGRGDDMDNRMMAAWMENNDG